MTELAFHKVLAVAFFQGVSVVDRYHSWVVRVEFRWIGNRNDFSLGFFVSKVIERQLLLPVKANKSVEVKVVEDALFSSDREIIPPWLTEVHPQPDFALRLARNLVDRLEILFFAKKVEERLLETAEWHHFC